MKRTLSVALLAAGAAPAAPAGAQLGPVNDDFDCYDPGAAVSPLPGWEPWTSFPGFAEAFISDDQAFSGTNSLLLNQALAHGVRRFDFESVPVTVRLMTYVPADSSGLKAWISLFAWEDEFGPPLVAMTADFDASAGKVEFPGTGEVAPIGFDRWVELRLEIDLRRGAFDLFYDDVERAVGVPWALVNPSGHVPRLETLSLYMETPGAGPGMYIDDVLVTQASATAPPSCGSLCYADCDASGAPEFLDFLCFQNRFAAGDARADCDGSGVLDFFDFLCFQNEFGAGCG